MLLREMTDPAFAHSFKRFARLAVAGLALAGLAACGGGGGSSTSTPTTPELTITPVDTPAGPEASAHDLVGAQAITSGVEITASLASADDVKFYRLEVAEERSEIEFTLDAEAGIEIAILDSNGYVIAIAETESMAKTTVSAAARTLYVRVRDKAKRGWDALNRTKAVKTFKLVSDVVAVARNLINLYKGIPHVTLAAGGAGFEFDLRDHFTLPDGRRIVSSVTASLPGVSASIQGTTVRLASGDVAHGGVRFVLRLCIPIVDYCFTEAFSGTIGRRGPTAKPEFPGIIRGSIADGETYTSRPLVDYFDYPAGATVNFVAQSTARPDDKGWSIRIEQGRLVVSTTSDRRSDDDKIAIYVTIEDSEGRTSRKLFGISVRESPEPGGTPAPASAACERMLGLYAEWIAAANERERACPADRSASTDEEKAARAASRLEGLNRIRSGDSPLPSELRSVLFWCAVDQGPGPGQPPEVEAALNAASRALSAARDSYSAAYRELERASPGGAGGICGY